MLKFEDSCDLYAALVLRSSAYVLDLLRILLALPCHSCLFAASPPLVSCCLFLGSACSLASVGVGVGSFVVGLSLVVWVGEIGPGPEPWTGLHCSELYWRDQWSSLLFSPERPRAAKSANMVRSVLIYSGISADGTLSG